MNRNTSIQLKAAFLLTVFALNTVVGFACAMGVDMGFNTTHHHDEETTVTPAHIHADGKKHHHESTHKIYQHTKETAEKDGCCNDEVVKFQNLEKNINQQSKSFVDAPVFVAILSSFLGVDFFNVFKVSVQKDRARFFHPPPPDILIAIQQFRI